MAPENHALAVVELGNAEEPITRIKAGGPVLLAPRSHEIGFIDMVLRTTLLTAVHPEHRLCVGRP